jgi:DNA repair exonuclease SbcCD nuclease subunit
MEKIKYIAHIGDIHIRKYKRHDEYEKVFNKLYKKLYDLFNGVEYDFRRIVIAGDLFHDKVNVTNELYMFTYNFIKNLSEISPLIIIPGNHDLLENNVDRIDTITPIVSALKENGKTIGYLKESKCFVDKNIVWCHYSIFDGYKKPNIEKYKRKYGDNKVFIGLYHGPLSGAITDTGYVFDDTNISMDIFDGLDIVMMGDIHKRSFFKYKETILAYPGSLIQQNFGESVSKHGFLFWDIENKKYEEVNIYNEHSFYSFKISDITDFDNINFNWLNK